jgi:hypothetical protein
VRSPHEDPELAQAKTQFDEAQKAMKQGDWRDFGKAMDALKVLFAAPAKAAAQN